MARENKSGFEVGCEYAEKLAQYLDSVGELPARNGTVNKREIARRAGIPRESLYTNPACVVLIEEAVTQKGLVGGGNDAELTKRDRRIATLERSNAALVAEVYELRRKLEQLRHVEEMLEQGRRVIP